jgi:hypothetical protein
MPAAYSWVADSLLMKMMSPWDAMPPVMLPSENWNVKVLLN